jgi:hypothetical protein
VSRRYVLTEDDARAVWIILREECGAHTHTASDFTDFRICMTTSPGYVKEFRFQGHLGFGGKLRLNGNRDGRPYVDCYREDETPERLAMIERANERLAAFFAEETTHAE